MVMETYFGVKVNPMVYGKGEGDGCFYAEVFPASPLLRYVAGTSLRYRIQRGRKNPFSRWWYEIHLEVPGDIGTHYQTHDGAAFSFRKAVSKASKATDELYWEKIFDEDKAVQI